MEDDMYKTTEIERDIRNCETSLKHIHALLEKTYCWDQVEMPFLKASLLLSKCNDNINKLLLKKKELDTIYSYIAYRGRDEDYEVSNEYYNQEK